MKQMQRKLMKPPPKRGNFNILVSQKLKDHETSLFEDDKDSTTSQEVVKSNKNMPVKQRKIIKFENYAFKREFLAKDKEYKQFM